MVLPFGLSETHLTFPQDINCPKLFLAYATLHDNLNVFSIILAVRCTSWETALLTIPVYNRNAIVVHINKLRSQPAHIRVKNRKCYPLVCSDVPVDIVTGCILSRILFNTSVFKYKAVGCSSFRKHKYPFFCCTVSVCEIL